MALALPEGWRGLAHFQLESRRAVLRKTPQERNFNELYILEEIAANIKFISSLPFSKRLEVCKLFRYQEIDSNTIVYKVGDLADSLYIIFTGSVKVATLGKRLQGPIILKPGDHFGEGVLVREDRLRHETITTNEKCELVLLTKQDYDSVLKTELSQEVKEKVEVLKSIRVLCGISDQSLQRLASLLIPRTYAKNRVIAFQGEDAMEMYFMKSGECRVVMEVCREPKAPPRPLPQAALRSSRLPSLSSKARMISQLFPPESRLPSLSSKMHTHGQSESSFVSKHDFSPINCSEPKFQQAVTLRPYYGSSSGKGGTLDDSCCPLREPCMESYEYQSGPDGSFNTELGIQEDRKNFKSISRLSFMSATTGSDMDLRGSIKGQCPQKEASHSESKNLSPSYSLKSFLKEFERRDSGELIPDLDFSDRQAASWKTGTNLSGMLRGDVSDAAVYHAKFENWARKVMAREKRLRAEAAIDQGIVSNIPREWMLNTWQARTKKPSFFEDTLLLDVGALHAGDFFGEIALLHHSQRKASILTVTAVEVLVLSKWDFNRQLDRDIIECLAANDYKNIECIFQEYRETCRWSLYKKKIMQEVLKTRQQRFPNLFEHDMCKGKPYTKFH